VKQFQRVVLHPGSSIVIIVDMENEFCKPGGKFYKGSNRPLVETVIGNIGALAQMARDVHIPVLYIQSVRTLREPEFTVFHREPHLEIGTWASAIVPELQPWPNDVVVQKFSHDPFHGTRLDETLAGLVPEPSKCCAVITGGAVNVCVYHTILGFYLRNYWTVLMEDGVYYGLPEGKDAALAMLSWRAYPNVFLTQSRLLEVSDVPHAGPPDLPLGV